MTVHSPQLFATRVEISSIVEASRKSKIGTRMSIERNNASSTRREKVVKDKKWNSTRACRFIDHPIESSQVLRDLDPGGTPWPISPV